MPDSSIKARIRNRVIRTGASSCWEWVGERACGYGRIRINGRKVMAHRASYEAHCGPIPNGMHVCHRCDNPCCCNPDHLFIGTRSDNIRDAIAKGRKKPVQGEASPKSKLAEKQISECIQLRAAGATFTHIGMVMKVSRVAVSNIISGKSWKHITRECKNG